MIGGGPWKDARLTITSTEFIPAAAVPARVIGWAVVAAVVAFLAGLLGGFGGALVWLAHPRW